MDELIETIRKVSTGEKYNTTSLAEKLSFDLETEQEPQLRERRLDREYQGRCMIGRGKTVSTHCGHILEKMKMKTNAELTKYVMKDNLVSLTG